MTTDEERYTLYCGLGLVVVQAEVARLCSKFPPTAKTIKRMVSWHNYSELVFCTCNVLLNPMLSVCTLGNELMVKKKQKTKTSTKNNLP